MSVKELNLPTPSYRPLEEPVNPYLKAKEEWDNRIGNARVQAFNWRIIALLAMGLCIILTIGLIYQSAKSTVTPYVVQVDKNGIAQAIGPAKESNYIPREKEIRYFLSQIVIKSRTIPLDPVVAKENWVSVYAFLRSAAAHKMNEIINRENPIAKIGNETLQTEINVIVPMSKNTYQIRWKEEVYTKEGTLKEAYRMTGLFTIEFAPPSSERELLVNPLGLYVKDFSWSKEL